MAASYILTDEAADELAAAHDWYEAERPGRGAKFVAHVEMCILTICRIPMGGSAILNNYRRAVVQKFPYIVVYHYEHTARHVTIVAIVHTSRDPAYLLRRLS